MSEADARHPLAPLPDHGYVFGTSWRLATGDVDQDRRLRLDGVARHIQEVGAEHLMDSGFAEVHPHWIVQRTVIDVIEPIEWPTDIVFRRWCSGISNRWCSMRVRLEGASGGPGGPGGPGGGRIETEGFWINMNKDTQTPSLIDDELFARFGSTTDDTRLKWRPWLPGPADADESTPFPLRHTDIDHFRHVNNTVYWHGVHEVMAQRPGLATAPYRAVVEYRKPIQPTDAVTIRWTARDGGVRVWFTVGETVHAAALVRPL